MESVAFLHEPNIVAGILCKYYSDVNVVVEWDPKENFDFSVSDVNNPLYLKENKFVLLIRYISAACTS